MIPGSHPSWTARLLLERKNIPYKRTDLVAVVSKTAVRLVGFPAATVPALLIDGERVQGSIAIARRLDELIPEPALFPTDPTARAAVEEAERWGEEILQPMPRRIVWNLLKRNRSATRSYLEGARLGVPTGLAAATAAPIIALAARFNKATDENVRADFAALGEALDKIDRLIADGVIGGAEPNAADFQIAPSIALLLTLDDIAPLAADRPAAALARRLIPDFPGHMPATAPAEFSAPLHGAA